MEFTPQQADFLKYFLDPKSETFGNAYQSAVKAKYSTNYAESITSQLPDWLADALGKSRRLIKAEKNLDLALDGALDDPEKGAKTIQYDASKFIAKTHRKDVYSERNELTGKDGEPIIKSDLTPEEKEKLLKLL